jgi:hypothetical protein
VEEAYTEKRSLEGFSAVGRVLAESWPVLASLRFEHNLWQFFATLGLELEPSEPPRDLFKPIRSVKRSQAALFVDPMWPDALVCTLVLYRQQCTQFALNKLL